MFSYYYYNDDLEYDIVNGSNEWEAMVDQAFEYWGIVSGINFVKIEEQPSQVGDIRIGLYLVRRFWWCWWSGLGQI